jgi:predicted glutamine amidotransferase
MCRFTLYMGEPVLISSVVTDPSNSLINQSVSASEGHFPFNGDGFGIAWYARDIRPEPARFRSLQPAWSNLNLLNMAGVIRSDCFLAHVRAATPGLPVSDANCHPFVHDRLSFMHNGLLAGFHEVRQRLVGELSPFVDRYAPPEGADHATRVDAMGAALQETVTYALDLVRDVATEPSYLNIAVSDGDVAAVCRVTDGEPASARSLYIHTDEPFRSDDSEYRSLPKTATLISSERLDDDDPGWEVVPPNTMVLVQRGKAARLKRIPAKFIGGKAVDPPESEKPDGEKAKGAKAKGAKEKGTEARGAEAKGAEAKGDAGSA